MPQPIFFFYNNGDGTFSDVALKLAWLLIPMARAGNGGGRRDLDGDGYLGNFCGELFREINALFHNDRDGLFTEITKQTPDWARLVCR